MCKAFSGIIVRDKRVYWTRGVDSHEDLKELFKLNDDGRRELIPFEISPANEDYLKPDKWVFCFDAPDGKTVECPGWWKAGHERACWSAFKQWKKETYALIDVKGLLALKNPFKDISPPKKITVKHKKLLKEWSSVWDSVRDSMWASVGDSVWDSVGGVFGSFFRLKRGEWKHTEGIKCRGYPFASAVKLWNAGFVPSFDGTTWRLHGGKDARVLYEVSEKELKKR